MIKGHFSADICHLSYKLDEIEEAINLDEMNNLNESCYDDDEHCFYGTSILQVINILDPVMGKINSLPMQQHHILQLAEVCSLCCVLIVSLIQTTQSNIIKK